MGSPEITLSVVSHAQNTLTNQLLDDLEQHCRERVVVVVTENVPDTAPLQARRSYPVDVVANNGRKGFGANHNTAFARCSTPFYCVANPDIRLTSDPFPALVEALRDPSAGVAGPLVRNLHGDIEDNARRFPTMRALAGKLFRRTHALDYPPDGAVIDVDWLAGMFLLFRSDAYRLVGGFDEAYFLYYEDADICRRVRRVGRRVAYVPHAAVVHDARRGSRRNPRLARHHAASMLRFLLRG
ncbi:MAG: glycosyltransferase [Vicinamibacterales bacterium]